MIMRINWKASPTCKKNHVAHSMDGMSTKVLVLFWPLAVGRQDNAAAAMAAAPVEAEDAVDEN